MTCLFLLLSPGTTPVIILNQLSGRKKKKLNPSWRRQTTCLESDQQTLERIWPWPVARDTPTSESAQGRNVQIIVGGQTGGRAQRSALITHLRAPSACRISNAQSIRIRAGTPPFSYLNSRREKSYSGLIVFRTLGP